MLDRLGRAAAAAAAGGVAVGLAGAVGVVCGQATEGLGFSLRNPSERCRMQPGSAHGYCGLPFELSNFQGRHECNDDRLVGRPRTEAEMAEMVRRAEKVKGLGVGHSWFKESFCPSEGSDKQGIGIVTTEMLDVRVPIPIAEFRHDFYNPLDEGIAYAPEFPPSYPIWVDEEARAVTVAAGVTQRTLLDYLSTFKGPRDLNRGRGWILPAQSWFIDQTIGGAVATNTHGSSLRYGSLSNSVLEYRLLLANGTAVEVSEQSNPHLMRALRTNVGRLGIITQLTMRIVPQRPIRRTTETLEWDDYIGRLKAIQADYNGAMAANNDVAAARALKPLEDTQIQWHSPLGTVWWAQYEQVGEVGGYVRPKTGEANLEILERVHDQVPFGGTPPSALMATITSSTYWANWFQNIIRPNFRTGVYPNRRAHVSLTDQQNRYHVINPYDQYELAVPVASMADCLERVGEAVYGPDRLYSGSRTPFLTRFVKEEDGYLSYTHGGPRVFVNMEEFVQYSTGRRNRGFQEIIRLFKDLPECSGRLHFGKAGWPEHGECWDGAQEYPETWCDFGCAAYELDPTAKFSSEWDGWIFRADVGGGGGTVDLLTQGGWNACCTAEGFRHGQCQCKSRGREGCAN